jgi:hypothetical protein
MYIHAHVEDLQVESDELVDAASHESNEEAEAVGFERLRIMPELPRDIVSSKKVG